MDDLGVDRAFLVALCGGARWALNLAHIAPERVLGSWPSRRRCPLALPDHDVIEHMAHPRWVGRYEEWVDYHSALMFAEPHSTKLREDLVAWALQTDAETLTVRLHADLDLVDEAEARTALANLACPVLVIHGTEDNCQPVERGPRSPRSPAGGWSRSRAPATCRTPGTRARQHADQGVRRHARDVHRLSTARDAVAVRARAQAPGALGLLADRPGPRAP